MRRFPLYMAAVGIMLIWSMTIEAAEGRPQHDNRPQLRKLAVPATQASSIATRLNLQYREARGVKIAPDLQNEQLLVMAPPTTQQAIAQDVQNLLASPPAAAAGNQSPLQVSLTRITWREFEDSLQRLSESPIPVTTSGNGVRAAFQMNLPRLRGTTVEVDRRNNHITVTAPATAIAGWQKLIESLDQQPAAETEVIQLVRFELAEPAPIQKAIRLLKELKETSRHSKPATVRPVFRNAVFQQDAAGQEVGGQANAGQNQRRNDSGGDQQPAEPGLMGNPEIQIIPELGQVIIKGTKRDAQRIMDLIKQIEEQSKLTKPDVEVMELQHADCNAVATLLQQLYQDVLSARQGEVSITSLDASNALLLIGRREAIAGLKELIEKLDQPIDPSSRLRVFRLQHASALDAEQTIRDFFTDLPGSGDELRPALGPRVRVVADQRTNSLIVSASPRDMKEITRLTNELDVKEVAAQSEIKIFPLDNANAEELAEVLQEAINGEIEVGGELTSPSSSVSIVAIDSESNQILDSGILVGAIVTADPGANAIVVRAPAASIPLISELIYQLDMSPNVDSLIKVFTITNGDAQQLTVALQDLFGADAATQGTSLGAANAAGLPASTAAAESSLVPLRFSTDQRTNSIIASGSEEDLEVVESILLRLDSEGFAERITEVIWLRHQTAVDVATAIQTYVQQRTQTVNTIQQFQQGLGPFDLPDRDLIVVAEPVSNSLLLSVSPRLYEDVRRVIDKLDRRPPMVMIQVLLAEVRLGDTFEIGGEFGLQDSLLYDRGVAADALPGAGAPSIRGFNFNNAGLPNRNSYLQQTLGTRGVTSFGVGTQNSTLGYGGFVLSAASDSISMLLRTLQDADRLQILSRPQINTMDNTDAAVQVGRVIARVTDVIININGNQVVTEDIPVGLILRVRPRVGSDGLIIMNVDITRSDRDTDNGTLVPNGDGPPIVIDDILETTAQSVVAAYNGQTVVFGGLIQKTRANFSRRVPYVSNIPLLGYLFKYDGERELRTELLLVMTPTLISGQEDLDYIKEVESSRMSWCLADVVEANGDVGLSGGYGLWGPAVGNTIYPDLQPTVDDVIVPENLPVSETPAQYPSVLNRSPVIIESAPILNEPSIAPAAPPVVSPPLPEMVPSEPIPTPSLPIPEPIPQSRFTPIEDGPAVQQTSFRVARESIPKTDRVQWSNTKWSKSPPTDSAPSRSQPMRLGGADEMLTSE